MEDPFEILSQQGVHFRNPKRVPAWGGSILFTLFFETDMNGNWDIYRVEYLMDGTVSDPAPVCVTPADERNFQYTEGVVVWQRNDGIVAQEYDLFSGFPPGSQPEVLDSGGCRNPAFSGYFCAWEKVVNNDSQAWFASREYFSGQWVWSSPVMIDSASQNTHLFLEDFITSGNLLWQEKADNLFRLKGMNLDYNEILEVPDFPGFNNEDPWFLTVAIPVGLSNPFPFTFLTWASDSTGNMEVYVNETLWDPSFFNISDHPLDDLNPRLFSVYGYTIRIYLTWESFRNDHWQIWITHQDIPIGISDQDTGNRSDEIQAYPNPSSGKTTLEFELPKGEPYRLEIFTSTGNLVYAIEGEAMGSGKQRVVWEARNTQGTSLPSGIYLVKIRSDNTFLLDKVILQD